jgi:5-methylcytosine-specific restriction endonuclease McrA
MRKGNTARCSFSVGENMKEYAEWFYKSPMWRKNRAAFLKSKFYVCERCQNRNGRGNIAHHKIYITPENIYDDEVTLNWDNLECLCQTCHNKEHHRDEEEVTREGLRFNENGQLVEENANTPLKIVAGKKSV